MLVKAQQPNHAQALDRTGKALLKAVKQNKPITIQEVEMLVKEVTGYSSPFFIEAVAEYIGVSK